MAKVSKLKRSFLFAAVIGLCLTLAFGCLGTLAAKAESNGFTDYPTTAVTVTNSQFSDTGSGKPAAPTGWTAEGSAGNAKAGIIDLKPAAYGQDNVNDEYKLKEFYSEYAENNYPQTPFGGTHYPGTNTNVLMVNTAGDNLSYGFTSSTFTLDANRFYSVSVYVKTGDFTESTGATVRLNGVDTGKGPENELAFHAINTVKDLPKDDATGNPILNTNNKFGFKQYTFYIATSYKSSTASLTLSVGATRNDATNDVRYNYPANGYAFFDNVEINELSPMNFYEATNGRTTTDTVIVRDLNDAKEYMYTDPARTDLARNDFLRIDDDEVMTGYSRVFVYNAQAYEEVDGYNFDTDPVSPNGKQGNSSIFCISTYEDEQLREATVAFRTADTFTVPRNGFARISVWAKTQDVTGDVSIKVSTDDTVLNNSNDGKLTSNSVTVTSTKGPAARYGWTEYALYVKGSTLKDYDVYVELWLGSSRTATAKGIAMFSAIRAELITPTEYTDNSGSGTAVTFDPTFTDTGVTNGMFYNAATYDELKYPLAPADWTFNTPDTVTTTGFSNAAVKGVDTEKDITSGIISTDEDHFNTNRPSYGIGEIPSDYRAAEYAGRNLLLLRSAKQAAAGYASTALTLTANTDYTLTVELATINVTGYGANLVVKNSNNNVISTIEQINTKGRKRLYTFYLEGGTTDQTVTLEMWLGLNDRKNNESKLSGGALLVSEVKFASVAADDTTAANAFKAGVSAYETAVKNGTFNDLLSAAYSFDSERFSTFDLYDDDSTNPIKTPYNWTRTAGDDNVMFGIVRTSNREPSDILKNIVLDPQSDNAGMLVLYNRTNAYSRIEWANKFSLAAGTYHKLTVRMRVDIESFDNADTAIGAGIELTGTNHKFENIMATKLVVDATVDENYYREYTFYINAVDTQEVGVAFTLGDDEYSNRKTAGIVYISEMAMEEIDNTTYDEQAEALKDKKSAYSIAAKLQTTATDDSGTDDTSKGGSPIQWWLIPSILFAVALVIAIVGVSVRKVMEKRSKRKTTQKASNYDRRLTINRQQAEKKTENGRVITETKDTFDEFDEDAPVAAKAQPAEAPAAVAPATEATETSATADTVVTTADEPMETPDAYTDEFDD